MKSQPFTFFAAVLYSISALAQVSDEITIEPDTELQAKIEEVAPVIVEGRGAAGERELELGLQRLLELADGNRQALMLQTIYWGAHFRKPGFGMLPRGFGGVVFQYLNFSDEEIMEMALPYLTKRTPQNVRYFAGGLLQAIYISEERPRTQDFTFFAERIANDSGRDPGELDGLIEFIYEEGPGEAVLALMRAHGASASEIAAMEEAETYFGRMYRRGYQEREINPEFNLDKIMAYLDQYSQSDRWWERLYVASMLGEVRQLRTDTVLRRLRSDLHPVIRAKLSGIHPKDER